MNDVPGKQVNQTKYAIKTHMLRVQGEREQERHDANITVFKYDAEGGGGR